MYLSNLPIIDTELLKLQRLKDTELEHARLNYLCLISDCLNINHDKLSIEQSLFNEDLPLEQKTFISVSLLRLACNNTDSVWYWDTPETRVTVFKFIRNYLKGLFSSLDIDGDLDNHVLLDEIREIENKLNQRCTDIIHSIGNTSSAYKVRKPLLRIIEDFYVILKFFIKLTVINKIRLNEIFDALYNYIEASPDEIFNSYRTVVEEIEKLIREANSYKTNYCQICIIDIFSKILETIKNDFNSKDYVKPTELKIDFPLRKYPLHLLEKPFQLKFNIFNYGVGYAFNTQLTLDCDDLIILNKELNVGLVTPGSTTVILDAIVQKEINDKNPVILAKCRWNNYDNSVKETEDLMFEILRQNSSIDWENLQSKQPYSLEAVENEEDLVGRTDIVEKIYKKLTAQKIESVIIHGQRRVGKTSIANVVKSKLQNLDNYIPVFIDVGELNKTSSEKFVNELGSRIFDEIVNSKKIRMQLHKPKFEGAISPLLQFFRDIRNHEEHKIVIIIDEFDEIPTDLFKFSEIGESFFHNIRSLSKESFIGFVLIGSENIEIIKQSTEKLNKFENFRVDYFDKEKYWKDFEELVKKPVKDKIEYEEQALHNIFQLTEGNPFYTNHLCRQIFDNAVDNRTPYVNEEDVEKALLKSINSLETNEVNHFWKDAIVQKEIAKRDNIETNRRKFLVSFADLARKYGIVNKEKLLNESKFRNSINVENMIESFKSREILISDRSTYRIRPRFIEYWLKNKGFHSITTGFLDEEGIAEYFEMENKIFVKDDEIVNLADRWSVYNSKKISSIEIRTWLDQFSDNKEKRIMFSLLQNLKFYGEAEIREKLTILHQQIINEIQTLKIGKEMHSREIVLTSTSNLAKSSNLYLRKYAQVNKVKNENIVYIDNLLLKLQNDNRVKVILTIDDIIASGNTQVTALNCLPQELITEIKKRNIKFITSSICGIEKSKKVIKENMDNLDILNDVILIDTIDESEIFFNENSRIFQTNEEKIKAKNIAYDYGFKLFKKHPLGYDDFGLLIVFFDNCPNNSLPILWARSDKNPKWFPLFERNYTYN